MNAKLRRINSRLQRIMAVTCLMLLAFYVGRVSVRHLWIEAIVMALWVANSLFWFTQLHREEKREEAEFRREMKAVEDNFRRRQLGIDKWGVED